MAPKPTSVREWPSYLLKAIPPRLRAQIGMQAAAEDLSLADVVRRILCSHYGLNCPPVGHGYNADRDEGAESMVIRMQPELWEAIKSNGGGTIRARILEILEAHYEGAVK